jgi:guanylate kinase
MPGKLLIVSGLSGAGKSTLIAAALHSLSELRYLRTATTRPMREGEERSYEYEFVSPAEYTKRREHSLDWDETLYHGYAYGADVDVSRRLLASGTNIICAVAPSLPIIQQMFSVYGLQPTVWLDTPAAIARQRIQSDDIRSARQENEVLKDTFDFIFTPVGDIRQDCTAFTSLVAKILS